jgi:uncharacterized protein
MMMRDSADEIATSRDEVGYPSVPKISRDSRAAQFTRGQAVGLAMLSGGLMLLALVGPVVGASPDRDVSECDRLAAHPYDNLPPGIKGVFANHINATQAVPACRAALALRPDDPRIAYQLGRALLSARGANDKAEGLRLIRRSAEAGHPAAMSTLGAIYEKGFGVPKDFTQARRLFEKAAAAGNADAMSGLGALYAYGHGVAKDYTQALQWYERAAAGGSIVAMFGLGLLYENGYGVRKNYTQAREWYEKAAAAGNADAMAALGDFYATGTGGVKNYTEARHWYEKAAVAGNADAMTNLGVLYEEGHGVPQDYTQARQWYEKAAAAGDGDAKKALRKLRGKK